MALAEIELEAKGYPARLARVALQRAWGTAERRAADVSPSIQEQAFLDILTAEIGRAEAWAQKMLDALNGSASTNIESEEEGGDNDGN